MINLVLCGGSGTRLWPLSRQLMPKQFVRLFGTRSLFQETVARNRFACATPYVVSNVDQYFLAVDQLEELAAGSKNLGGPVSEPKTGSGAPQSGAPRFLLEPVGRNTAPAIALACLTLDPSELVLVTPSDHLIKDQKAYEKAIAAARELAAQGFLVTFGITPTGPETGYGYIEADVAASGPGADFAGADVKRFVEKPNLETAQQYLAAGNYFWNSGMFCFTAGAFLAELEQHAPAMVAACRAALADTHEEAGFLRIRKELMLAIPADSIDYVVMEKSRKVKVVPADIGWNDLGSFESLYEELPKDAAGNTLHEKHICIDSHDNLIMPRDRIIATIDLHDHIVVDTSDALLVAPRGSSQKVKAIVDALKAQGSELATVHATAARPWGTYTVVREGSRYKLKRIVVKPGARLSLQKHLHRSEHWIVLAGTAQVTNGEQTFLVRPNESTYIPMGQMHRLENPGKVDLEIVEVQVGDYVGEDDIQRFDDDYCR
jgi:mannose-1-phosphate guanylyltransferase